MCWISQTTSVCQHTFLRTIELYFQEFFILFLNLVSWLCISLLHLTDCRNVFTAMRFAWCVILEGMGWVVISKGPKPHVSSSQRNASLSNSGPAAHEPRRPHHQHGCAGTGRYVWRGSLFASQSSLCPHVWHVGEWSALNAPTLTAHTLIDTQMGKHASAGHSCVGKISRWFSVKCLVLGPYFGQ